MEYAIVDRMVPHTCIVDGIPQSCGPQVDVEGNLIGDFIPHPKVTALENLSSESMFACDAASMQNWVIDIQNRPKCGQLMAIGITSRDAVTNDQIAATFGINCDTTACTQRPVSAAYVPDPLASARQDVVACLTSLPCVKMPYPQNI
jgi:hypothetical protein